MKPLASLRTKLFAATLALLLASSAGTFAANYTVNTTADSGPGSLRDAITLANANPGADTIGFAPALTASAPATISLTSALPAITESVTISGPGQSKLTVKNGVADPNNPFANPAGSFRVFTVAVDAPGVVSFSGLTVSNGAVFEGNIIDQSGGGIMNAGTGTLNLTDSAIINNFAESTGGGIINLRTGILNLTRCTITGNSTSSGSGGGIANGGVLNDTPGGTLRIVESLISDNHTSRSGGGIFSSSTPQGGFYLINSTVTSNTASSAGGIFARGGTTVSISGCTISNNQGTTGGSGGLTLSGATANIISSTFSGNTVGASGSGRGGGMQILAATVNVTNCTLANNQALGPIGSTGGLGGGAIGIRDVPAVLTIKNSTISGNSSNSGAGGILNFGLGSFVATVNVSSSIVAGNSSALPVEDAARMFPLISQGFNVIGDNELSPVTPIAGDQAGVTVAQLNIAALGDNGGLTKTMALLPGSVALDKGIANGLTTDQRGYGRVFDNTAVANAVDGADVGAFEAQSLTFVVATTADSGPGSLRDALTQSNENPDADKITFAIPTSDPGYNAAGGGWTISLLSALPSITDSATITGPGKDKLTVRNGLVDPNDPIGEISQVFNPATGFRIFTVAVDAPGIVTISSLTAANGVAMFFSSDSSRHYGGGILNAGAGTLNVTDSAITKNVAYEDGGGIANFRNGNLNVTRCTISDNGKAPLYDGTIVPFTRFGGGISNGGSFLPPNSLVPGGTVRIVDSVISGNGATGGGIGSYAGAVIVVNSRVTGNSGKYGTGGISATLGTVSILNSTINDNISGTERSAGGISLDRVSADITNSTLNGNIGTLMMAAVPTSSPAEFTPSPRILT